jgi:uncharacterized protein YndB with AHSA1/START domain
MKLQKSIEIAAPPEKIWPYLVEPEKIMKWFTLLKKFEYTSKRCSGVGTTFYYEERMGPLLTKLNYRVTEWVENEKFAFILTSGLPKKDDQIWALEVIPSGSRFTFTEVFEIPWGIIGKALDILLAGNIGKGIEGILANLKKVVEAENNIRQ